MTPPTSQAKPSTLRKLEELPGIADVVWATVTRLADAQVPTTVLFTAAEKRAGSTVLAAATAIGLVRHQRVPVCLIETNLQRPALADYLGLERAGLSDVLDGRAELEDCMQEPHDCSGLFVLPAGTARAPISGELTTERWVAALAQLEQSCHYVVLDAAPLLEHVESRVLLRYADAVLLVLRARATLLGDAERAHDILVESGTPVLGSIFNAYQADGLLGGNGRANRRFVRAARADRPRISVAPWTRRGEAAAVGVDDAPVELEDRVVPSNGGPLPGNGGTVFEIPTPPGTGSEAAHRHQVDILERRIAKLNVLLAQAEANLLRIAAMKDVDLGIASIYRGVQGLSSEEDAQELKKMLMREIFQANMALKRAIARHS
jgi:Mrp family chromosome partitioning ATPase